MPFSRVEAMVLYGAVATLEPRRTLFIVFKVDS